MNQSNLKSRRRAMLSVSRLAILSLIVSCGIDKAKAQSQWTTNGNNIYNTNTGNVGIGTAAPLETLHLFNSSSIFQVALQGGLNNSGFIGYWNPGGLFLSNNRNIRTGNNFNTGSFGAQLVLGNNGDGNTGDITFQTISSGIIGTPLELLRMKSNGNIGIGTANPGRKLEVLAPNGEAVRLYRNANSVGWGVNMTFAFNNSSNAQVDYAGVHGIIQSNTAGAENGNLVFTVASGSTLTERMRILSSGNVGIGTTAPAAKLHIVSGNDNPNTLLWLDTGVHGGSQFLIGGTTNNESYLNLNVYRAGLYFTRLSVNNFGHLLLQPGGDGNVGIGTSVPNYKLDVQGGQVNASAGLCIAGDCKTAWSQVGGGSSPWSTSGSTVYYNGGNVGIGTTTAVTKLEVAPNTAIKVGNAYLSSGGDYAHLANNEWYNGSSWTATAPGALIQVAGQDVNFYRHDALGSHTHSMTINSAGNVGIGTNAPATKLHVVGDGKVTGNLTVDGNIAAKYQDVAEWVPATEPIPAGTVVVLDSTKSNHVISSTQAYDIRVAGVISEKPGIVLGESGGNKVLVATTGRVRIRVDATRGPIRIGDLLVTSDISGMAMKSEPVNLGGVQIHRPGTLIGKALEPLAKGQGEILVLLSLQ